MCYITRARGSNVKVPHLAVQGASKEFVSLLSNVPHVARNVRYVTHLGVQTPCPAAPPKFRLDMACRKVSGAQF